MNFNPDDITEEQAAELMQSMFGQAPTLRESLGLDEDALLPTDILSEITSELFRHLLKLAQEYEEIAEGVTPDGTSLMCVRLAASLGRPLSDPFIVVLQAFENLVQTIISADNEERVLAGADVPLLDSRGREVS